jgi:hypothetical protein
VSWEPINLRHVPDEPPEPPDYLGLVYRGRRHWFSGPPESLKTLVAYIILLVALRTGERVALIDFEMGQRDARNRLREMGATDEELDLIEFYEPDTAPTKETLQGIADRCSLVVIDAAAGQLEPARPVATSAERGAGELAATRGRPRVSRSASPEPVSHAASAAGLSRVDWSAALTRSASSGRLRRPRL